MLRIGVCSIPLFRCVQYVPPTLTPAVFPATRLLLAFPPIAPIPSTRTTLAPIARPCPAFVPVAPVAPTHAPHPPVLFCRLRLRLRLRLEPLALLLVPRLPVRLVARLLPRRHLVTIPDLVASPTSVEVHVGGEGGRTCGSSLRVGCRQGGRAGFAMITYFG